MIAAAGWQTFARDPSGAVMIVSVMGLALNFAWSPIFFRAQRSAAALVIILILLLFILCALCLLGRVCIIINC